MAENTQAQAIAAGQNNASVAEHNNAFNVLDMKQLQD
jgi:hypothetical protein